MIFKSDAEYDAYLNRQEQEQAERDREKEQCRLLREFEWCDKLPKLEEIWYRINTFFSERKG